MNGGGGTTTGSFTGSFTGSLLGTASLALTASYFSGSITSASYAISSSYSERTDRINVIINSSSATFYPVFVDDAGNRILYLDGDFSYVPSTNQLVVGGITSSLYGTSSYALSSSYSLSSSVSISSSYASSSTSASYASSSTSASYAETASLAPNYVLNSATSSFITNSQTSSFVQNSQTSSFSTGSFTGSFTGSLFGTASYVTGSIFTSTNRALSASNALTASYYVNGSPTNALSLLSVAGSVIKSEPLLPFHLFQGSTYTLASQRLVFSPVYISQPQTITGVKWFQVATGSFTSSNYNGFGLYTLSAGNLTCVASSSNNGNTFSGSYTATANTFASTSFGATYLALPGTYFVGYLWSRSAVTTIPTIGQYATLGGYNNTYVYDYTNSTKTVSYIDAQTTMPTSLAMSTTTVLGILPFLNLY